MCINKKYLCKPSRADVKISVTSCTVSDRHITPGSACFHFFFFPRIPKFMPIKLVCVCILMHGDNNNVPVKNNDFYS